MARANGAYAQKPFNSYTPTAFMPPTLKPEKPK
jgi:hypothetical protein